MSQKTRDLFVIILGICLTVLILLVLLLAVHAYQHTRPPMCSKWIPSTVIIDIGHAHVAAHTEFCADWGDHS